MTNVILGAEAEPGVVGSEAYTTFGVIFKKNNKQL
jgi:hypothetical protein